MNRLLDTTPFFSFFLLDLPLEVIVSIFWILFKNFEKEVSSYKALFRIEIVSKKFQECVIVFANLAEKIPGGGGREVKIKQLSRKRLEIYHPNLKKVVLSYCSKLKSDDISTVLSQSLTTLVIDELWQGMFNDIDLKLLTNLTSLTYSVGDFSRCYGIRTLFPFSEEVSDNALKPITQLTTLKLIGHTQKITGIGICATSIQNLYLNVNNFNFSLIKTFQNLVDLRFGDKTKIDDSYFLENMQSLKTLFIGPLQKITDRILGSLRNLTYLHLPNNQYITNDGLKQLVNLSNLDLSVGQLITNEALENLTNLTILCLDRNLRITSSIFAYLPNITSLSLFESRMTDDFVHFTPNLTCLSITRITPNLDILTRLEMLRIFDVAEENDIHEREENDILEKLENLRVLCLAEIEKPTTRPREPIRGNGNYRWNEQHHLKFLRNKYESILIDGHKWQKLTSFPVVKTKKKGWVWVIQRAK